ncbi:MAG: hypothetical protein GF315_05215 [candidate division Zixibacteria bacterium]|nr:hypothetical protein [candidate division Zixibacteria bacterium]
MIRKLIAIAILSGVLLLGIFTDSNPTEQAVTRNIKKGETISFLSLKIYGYYNEEIALLIKDANPEIDDLNLIRIGQQVIFPRLTELVNKPYSVKTTASTAVVTFIDGKARFLKSGLKDWRRLTANTILTPGDKIKTGERALVELVVNNTDVLRLSSNTELTIEGLSKTEKSEQDSQEPEANFKFSMGKIWAKIKSYVERSGKFEVSFPTAVAAVQGTVYNAELNPDSLATLKVYRGRVEVAEKLAKMRNQSRKLRAPSQVSGPKQVSMTQWVKIVREMQQLSFGPGQAPGDPEDFQEDWSGSWEKFNKQRDQLFEGQLK